jgi:hypothetical protein
MKIDSKHSDVTTADLLNGVQVVLACWLMSTWPLIREAYMHVLTGAKEQ